MIQQSYIPNLLGQPSVPIARINATSSRPLEFTFIELRDQSSSFYSPEQLGLTIINGAVHITATVLKSLHTMSFPIRGSILVNDDRTSCVRALFTTVGACTSTFWFTLDILTDFNPPCPADVFLFSPLETAVASWMSPRVLYQNGTEFEMVPSAMPASEFPLGVTDIVYLPKLGIDSSQLEFPLASVLCWFKVRQPNKPDSRHSRCIACYQYQFSCSW
jgi:hypothetical protein